MTLYHCGKAVAHSGTDGSLALCRQMFYWPKMKDEFQIFIRACNTCNVTKPPQRHFKAPLRYIIANHFGQGLVIDHIVPAVNQQTPRIYRYILTMTDASSNYVVACPVKTQTAEENICVIMRK